VRKWNQTDYWLFTGTGNRSGIFCDGIPCPPNWGWAPFGSYGAPAEEFPYRIVRQRPGIPSWAVMMMDRSWAKHGEAPYNDKYYGGMEGIGHVSNHPMQGAEGMATNGVVRYAEGANALELNGAVRWMDLTGTVYRNGRDFYRFFYVDEKHAP
jgi:hypothetical protein